MCAIPRGNRHNQRLVLVHRSVRRVAYTRNQKAAELPWGAEWLE
jgi:hypothetical protein